jgi:hypothetical protein
MQCGARDLLRMRSLPTRNYSFAPGLSASYASCSNLTEIAMAANNISFTAAVESGSMAPSICCHICYALDSFKGCITGEAYLQWQMMPLYVSLEVNPTSTLLSKSLF